MIIDHRTGDLPQKLLLACLYMLAFLVSIQVREPQWQAETGDAQSVLTARSIHLLPLQEQHSKQTSIPVYVFPTLVFQVGGSFSHRLFKLQVSFPLAFLSATGRVLPADSGAVLLPVLRI